MLDVYINAYFKHGIQNLTLYFLRLKHKKTPFSHTVDTGVLFLKGLLMLYCGGENLWGFVFS